MVSNGRPDSRDDPRPPGEGPEGDDDQGTPGFVILLSFAVIAVVCVGGYLLLNKLIDISRQEDCLLAGRRNCAPIVLPSGQ